MRRTSLANAKAHLSALVSQAQHRGRRIIILRHGKPSAAIVPVDVALSTRSPARDERRRGLSGPRIRALFKGFGRRSGARSAVGDLLASRR